MRIILTFLVVALAAGCTTSKRGTSRVDPFDDIRVDQMAGNNVSGAVLQKIVLCLNARRETRPITGLTNIVVTPVTNLSVLVLTNQTLSASTNFFVTTATNLSPAVPPFPASTAPAGGDVSLETAPETAATRANPVAMTTNLTLTIARNQSGTTSPTQTAANNQAVRTLSNQITTVSNNLAVTVLTNLVVTLETNQVLTYVTNLTVSSVTNITMAPTNGFQHDYFLYTELLGANDFNPQTGESLVLLIDGERYGFSAAQSGTVFVSRKGFTSTLYRVAPQVLVAIANAAEVRLRLKGSNSVIERTLSNASKRNFKAYLVQYFRPEAPEKSPSGKSAPAGRKPLARASASGGSVPAAGFPW